MKFQLTGHIPRVTDGASHVYNPRIWKVEAGETEIQSQSWLLSRVKSQPGVQKFPSTKKRGREGEKEGGEEMGKEGGEERKGDIERETGREKQRQGD